MAHTIMRGKVVFVVTSTVLRRGKLFVVEEDRQAGSTSRYQATKR